MRIFKYQLPVPEAPSSYVDVEMPEGARVLSAGAQNGEVVVWALVDPHAKTVLRRFAIYPTGLTEVPEHPVNFVGTVMLLGGALVFHVFDVGEEPHEPPPAA